MLVPPDSGEVCHTVRHTVPNGTRPRKGAQRLPHFYNRYACGTRILQDLSSAHRLSSQREYRLSPVEAATSVPKGRDRFGSPRQHHLVFSKFKSVTSRDTHVVSQNKHMNKHTSVGLRVCDWLE
ncbi:hypothetical protein E2C01_083028 [Portunus trituberculatus]|uniref:Uncharacterized protein n=1 Tax=Portunus trituberculatus TaxID=210409 RepID=A0A5B7J019_PORTR|nr:hypothetical protein [Portunus trituberculatus]